MDLKVDHLIEKIRQEGIEEARQTAQNMVDSARSEARTIVEQARKEAEAIVSEAHQEREQIQKKGDMALRQSARDVELLLKERLLDLFDRIFKRKVAETLSPEFLKDLILNRVSRWNPDESIEITVGETDLETLEAMLFQELGEALKEHIVIRVHSRVSNGFRIGLTDGHVYYDFSDEAISEALRVFLNPHLRAVLDQDDG